MLGGDDHFFDAPTERQLLLQSGRETARETRDATASALVLHARHRPSDLTAW